MPRADYLKLAGTPGPMEDSLGQDQSRKPGPESEWSLVGGELSLCAGQAGGMPGPVRPRAKLVCDPGTTSLGKVPGGVVPASCSSGKSRALGLVVTGGLVVTRGLGRVNFFRFFIMTFFFLTMRIWTYRSEVPRNQGGTAPGKEEGQMQKSGNSRTHASPQQHPSPHVSKDLRVDLKGCAV